MNEKTTSLRSLQQRPDFLEEGARYRIIEGDYKELSGTCIEIRESSFGRRWAILKVGHELVVKRVSDLKRILNGGLIPTSGGTTVPSNGSRGGSSGDGVQS
jgi:hypothetical protein